MCAKKIISSCPSESAALGILRPSDNPKAAPADYLMKTFSESSSRDKTSNAPSENGRQIKDVTICFRTSAAIREYLLGIAAQKRQTLSYTIESIIYNYKQSILEKRSEPAERRRYGRKAVSLPALVSATPAHMESYCTGTVLDLSLGGLRLAMSKNTAPQLQPDSAVTDLKIVFTLPDQRQPVTISCRPQNIEDTFLDVHVGAAFIDADFTSYQNLQNYLI